MSLTPQDVADTLNAAGFDDTTKFGQMLSAVSPLVQREVLLARIAKAQSDAQATNAASQSAVQTLQAQLNTLDATFNQTFGA